MSRANLLETGPYVAITDLNYLVTKGRGPGIVTLRVSDIPAFVSLLKAAEKEYDIMGLSLES